MKESTSARLDPTERTKLLLWGAAAGRCTLCNRSVLENEDLGIPVPIGELAHAVGAEDGSPRGTSDLTPEERRQPDNLLLLCRNCHKPESMNLRLQTPQAASAHQSQLLTGEKSCIDCHKGIAHKLPVGEEIQGFD